MPNNCSDFSLPDYCGGYKSESRIQQEIVTWYKNNYCLQHHNPRCMIFSIPNEGLFQTASLSMPKRFMVILKQAIKRLLFKLISTGLYPGCADLCVIHQALVYTHSEHKHYSPTTIFFEVKTPEAVSGPKKNGQSANQISFEKHCKQMSSTYNKIPYHIVRSLDEFRHVVEKL